MGNSVLKSLLKDYEHKKLSAEMDLEERRTSLFSSLPKLEKIEDDLNSFALKTTKAILNGDDKNSLKKLNIKINKLKKEKEKLLTSNGYDSSYLKPNYECSICEDTGFVTKNGRKVLCSCLKQHLLDISYDNSNMYNLKTENFSTFDADLFSDEVDFAKYGQNISPRENILNIKSKVLEFVKNFDNPDTKNLLFCGNTGSR